MKPFGKIPEGWMPYSPTGNQIIGTRFIAFKAPLREAFVDKLKQEDRFTITNLLERIPELGLVIDLTQTKRYYNKNDVLERGVDYVKIPVPGQVVPGQEYVDRFFEVVDYYLDTHKDDDTLIGVHCTHGVNRTGYIICRYLIQRLGFNPEEAISAFGSARGHLIERSNYLDDLRSQNLEAVERKTSKLDLGEVDIWKYFNSLADKLPDTIKPRKRKGRKRAHGQVGDAEKDKVLVEGSESASTKTNSENKSPSNLQNAQNGKPKKKKRVSEKRKERRKKYFEKLKELRIQGKLAETNNGTGNNAVGGNAEDVLNTPAAPTIDLTGDLQLKATIAADRSKRNHLNLTADYLSESVRQETAMDLSMPNPTDAVAAPNPIETGSLTNTLPVIPSSPILTEPSEVVAIEANSEAGQPV